MRAIWLAVLAACHATPSRPAAIDLSYVLERAQNGVHVIVTTTAAASEETTFELVDSDWYEHPETAVHDVAATVDGEPTIVVHDGVHWRIHAHQGTPITFAYTIVPVAWDRHHAEYGPVAGEHFVHLNGETTLVWPKHLDDATPKRIAVFWRGWSEAGWRTASSYGTAASAIVDEKLSRFIQAAFLASDRMEVIERDGIAVAVVDADWRVAANELASATAKLIDTEWKFMRERAPQFFFADFVPFPTGHGTGLNHSLSVLTGADTQFRRLAFTIAHELFHHWNGVLFVGPQWFREGFTNFYARKLVRRAEVYQLEEAVDQLDLELRHYALSPYRDLGEVAAEERSAIDGEVQDMVYARGDLIALMIDSELRRASHGSRSLDDIMRALVADRPAHVSDAQLLSRFARATSHSFAGRIQSLLEHGGEIEIDPAAFAPCLTGERRAFNDVQVLQFRVADPRACAAAGW